LGEVAAETVGETVAETFGDGDRLMVTTGDGEVVGVAVLDDWV
jgi:hypothetical protein